MNLYGLLVSIEGKVLLEESKTKSNETIPHLQERKLLMASGATPFRLSRETSDAVLEYSRKTHTLLHNTWSIKATT